MAPVVDEAKRADITRIPGTKVCSVAAVPIPVTEMSSGPNRARKNRGWTIEKMTEKGLRSVGRSSRTSTVVVSRTRADRRVVLGGRTGRPGAGTRQW